MSERIALHIGIDIRSVYDVGRRLANASFEGDGWNAWGEPVSSAGNDGTTFHLVVVTTPPEAEQLVVEMAETLVPMHNASVVAVETLPDDWDVAETGGRVWHRVTRVDGSPMLVTEHVLALHVAQPAIDVPPP